MLPPIQSGNALPTREGEYRHNWRVRGKHIRCTKCKQLKTTVRRLTGCPKRT